MYSRMQWFWPRECFVDVKCSVCPCFFYSCKLIRNIVSLRGIVKIIQNPLASIGVLYSKCCWILLTTGSSDTFSFFPVWMTMKIDMMENKNIRRTGGTEKKSCPDLSWRIVVQFDVAMNVMWGKGSRFPSFFFCSKPRPVQHYRP